MSLQISLLKILFYKDNYGVLLIKVNVSRLFVDVTFLHASYHIRGNKILQQWHQKYILTKKSCFVIHIYRVFKRVFFNVSFSSIIELNVGPGSSELLKHRIYAPCLTCPGHTTVMALEGFLMLIINYEVVH